MSLLRGVAPFAAVSLIAIITGGITAHLHGVGTALIALNGAAWVIGLGAALLLSRLPQNTALPIVLLASLVLALTLVSPGMQGVHRWLSLGPIKINAAEALLPLILAVLSSPNNRFGFGLPIIVAALLALQPDASQAGAFVGGALVLVFANNSSLLRRALPSLVLIAAFILPCLRPDPLPPVPHVEGILALAAQTAPALAALGLVSLVALVLLFASPALRSAPSPHRTASLALAVYFAIASLAPAFGAYPVPLIGIGISPIIGLWLGIGWRLRLA